ncbi:MAG: hypothetical protein JSS07_08405 [Proteobacteria bacterium]|nr:hypothetical protein [Pseudomonadota bacterium]
MLVVVKKPKPIKSPKPIKTTTKTIPQMQKRTFLIEAAAVASTLLVVPSVAAKMGEFYKVQKQLEKNFYVPISKYTEGPAVIAAVMSTCIPGGINYKHKDAKRAELHAFLVEMNKTGKLDPLDAFSIVRVNNNLDMSGTKLTDEALHEIKDSITQKHEVIQAGGPDVRKKYAKTRKEAEHKIANAFWEEGSYFGWLAHRGNKLATEPYSRILNSTGKLEVKDFTPKQSNIKKL